ncbi:MAG: heavy metal translocating P-type ATPase [Thermovirgaceae bacterium]|nr:heavy metal translocating P-type ATPase [Thermovirgaceae bacterium]
MQNENDKKETTKTTVRITGMTCAACSNAVERAIRKVEGVDFAAVNLATETAFVVHSSGVTFDDLGKAVESVGYGVSREIPEELDRKRYLDSRKNLLLALAVTTPLAVLMVFHMLGIHMPWFPLLELVAAGYVIFYVGRGSIKGAWIAVTHLHTNMDTLISIGSVAAWITTLLNVSGIPIASFGSIGAMIVALHVSGRFIESSLRDKAAKEIKNLLKLRATEARIVVDGKDLMVPIEAVTKGMSVKVRPGERIPVDGDVISGRSSVDESMITGESMPVIKENGALLTGGALNITGELLVSVTKTGEDTFLSQMVSLVQEAQGSKIPIQALADGVTRVFVPIVTLLAAIAGGTWFVLFPVLYPRLEAIRHYLPWVLETDSAVSFGVFVFVATIVIACPCALGLATPMALVAGTGMASKRGLLIRNAEAIQTTKDIEVVLMDKTGTLTAGDPSVVFHNLSASDLAAAAAIERRSGHPLAKAIGSAVEGDLPDPDPESIEEMAGKGVRGMVGGKLFEIGKPRSFEDYTAWLGGGKTVVEVVRDGEVAGFFAVEDPIREDSASAVEEMKRIGITPVMITGDNETTARAVAERVGITEVHAGVRPEEKLEIVRKYQASGKKILMIGDGINDAAALKGADIGMAIGSGMDLAIDSADIVVMSGGVSRALECIKISGKTFRIITQNLFWAFLYNIVAIPVAMAGLLHPAIAEIAMAMSSISVVLNSLRIKKEGS